MLEEFDKWHLLVEVWFYFSLGVIRLPPKCNGRATDETLFFLRYLACRKVLLLNGYYRYIYILIFYSSYIYSKYFQ